LLCPDGQIGNGVALTGLYNDNHPAPASTLAELIAFADGAILSYDPDTHHLAAILPDGASATIKATTITLDAETVHSTGDITAEGDVIAGGISLKGHRHGGVQAGRAVSEEAF
jgi:phage baseplate assembly protein V